MTIKTNNYILNYLKIRKNLNFYTINLQNVAYKYFFTKFVQTSINKVDALKSGGENNVWKKQKEFCI